MTKSSSALLSLVAAIPAALLAYLLVMAFIRRADVMGGTLNAVVGVALLAAVAAALMPVGILIFGGPKGATKPKAAKASKPSKKKGKDEPPEEEPVEAAVGLEDVEEEPLADEEEEFATAESDAMLEEFDADEDVGLEAEWDEEGEGVSDEFEFEDALSDDELDFDFDDDEKK